ncbi:MAG: hypothetical protein CVU56_24520 [Deltaproteobacteria bacterium HGW-Deltaproteobacteria-14]|nr:MAG: hypothetical protein CVU56_24520 [Deltaproteobacteria bacterium HGW-Deltaproteobacteria-14]
MLSAGQLRGIRLDDPKLIAVSLHRMARYVLVGKLSHKLANCVGQLASIALRAHDTADIAERLDALEAALDGRDTTTAGGRHAKR